MAILTKRAGSTRVSSRSGLGSKAPSLKTATDTILFKPVSCLMNGERLSYPYKQESLSTELRAETSGYKD
jgi:hypothetical protein